MYTFICEDSPNGIFSGVYDAWAFKIQQNKQMPDDGGQSGSRAAGQTRCTHDDIRLTSREPDNYELFSQYFQVTPSAEKSDKVARTLCTRLGTEFYETVMNALLAIIPERKGEIDKADAIYHTVVLALSSPAGANTLHRLNHPHVHRHIHATVWLAARRDEPLPQVRVIVYPTLKFPVGHLGAKRGKIALRQLRAAVCANVKMFHNRVVFHLFIMT